MHEQVDRPDDIDPENGNLSQPDYTDMELRDIRYRLNVLDHKLDTVLSKLDGQEEVIRRSDSRWQLISVFLESIHGSYYGLHANDSRPLHTFADTLPRF